MNATQKAERTVRKLIRKAARCSNPTQSVVLVDEQGGKDSIGFTGISWRYETRGGQRIWHPSAYSKKGFSNMVYVASTLRLECGREFFAFLSRFLAS